MKKVIFILGVIGLLLVGKVYAADMYAIDPANSTIGFAVKHLMVSTTNGSFSDYQGGITYDDKDLSAFKADMTIQAKSIDTKVEQRDNHLRSAEFLDTAKFPTITFTSKSLLPPRSGVPGGTLIGDLTIKGVTKEVSIPVAISGPVKAPFGMAIGLSGQLTINRQDYGVSFNKALDNGGLMVGNDVVINIDIEAHKK